MELRASSSQIYQQPLATVWSGLRWRLDDYWRDESYSPKALIELQAREVPVRFLCAAE